MNILKNVESGNKVMVIEVLIEELQLLKPAWF